MTSVRKSVCYRLCGVMEICRYSTQPNANAFIDCIYHVIIQPIPYYTPANSRRRRAVVTHFST